MTKIQDSGMELKRRTVRHREHRPQLRLFRQSVPTLLDREIDGRWKNLVKAKDGMVLTATLERLMIDVERLKVMCSKARQERSQYLMKKINLVVEECRGVCIQGDRFNNL